MIPSFQRSLKPLLPLFLSHHKGATRTTAVQLLHNGFSHDSRRTMAYSFESNSGDGDDSDASREDKLKRYIEQRSWSVGQVIDSLGECQGVFSIRYDESVYAALQLMDKHDTGSICVVDDQTTGSKLGRKRLLGILTERDYVRKVILKGKDSRQTPVEAIMTPREKLITVTPQYTVHECLHLMKVHHFRHLPVEEYAWDSTDVSSKKIPPPGVVAMVSQRNLVDQFLDYHDAQVKYLQEYIPFPLW